MSKLTLKGREPVSSFTHAVGAVLSIAATLALMLKAHRLNVGLKPVVSSAIFGVSLIALYTASATYHYIMGPPDRVARLRKVDHSMIYVLIAGSYTPLILQYLPGRDGVVFTAVMWGVAAVGTLIKVCWMGAPRLLSTAFYIAMGWAIVLAPQAITSMQPAAVTLVAAGGISYTIGAVIYFIKKPNPTSSFGFHELFHIFVMVGSAFHFFAVYFYVV